jgi:hypothetical protein
MSDTDQNQPTPATKEPPALSSRRPWDTPRVIQADPRLAMHGNCGGIDGVFSSS